MKRRIVFLYLSIIFTLSISSCGNEEEDKKIEPFNEGKEILGAWKLNEVRSNGFQSEVANTVYYEVYEFNADGTFTKRLANGTIASGTYQYSKSTTNSEGYIETSFDNSNMSFSCIGGNKEHLKITYSIACGVGISTIYIHLSIDNSPCDGPTLYYEKIKSAPVD